MSVKDFFTPRYIKHNAARLSHLQSLNLDLNNKKVLEVGAGSGDHTKFFLEKGCDVLATDARPELVKYISKKLGCKTLVLDLENELEKIRKLGKFDILYCYGLLYHLGNPGAFLTEASKVSDCILLETCVTYGKGLSINPVKENIKGSTQSATGRGSRPTREWVYNTLKKLYPFVYCPVTQPKHYEFPTDWTLKEQPFKHLTRAVFVASHQAIENNLLTTELPEKYVNKYYPKKGRD